ncbi:ABC-2 type transport system permease protein [Pseudarthrobacter sp. PvP004]|uniref:ABC transporter permease n=1 Tax=Pseudarthrobacter sp. PvP004 TaxID=2817850 RepID=UPI001AE96582|nr:ABC transporter permease [Pseudarthrobacter sp. PvP004]MBP2269293.1 ABC-2 type transport system permease protein [Pseudarthrobacter sp. PvP004]
MTTTTKPSPTTAPSPAKRSPLSRHNLGTVVGFEFGRTVKKPRFWIATLAIPVVMAIIFVLIFASNTSTSASAQAQKNASLNFTYTDASGIIPEATATAMGGKKAPDPDTAQADVRAGTSDAYFDYPANPATDTIQVYGADKGVFANNTYEAVAKQLLAVAAQTTINSPELTAAASGEVKVQTQTFRDGQVSGGFGSALPPLMFLLLFYVVILLLSSQMLNSTLEEKENRVTEMILTTLNPTTLIVGKIISLFLIGLVQISVFLTPVIIGYVFFRDRLSMPDFDLSTLTFEPGPLIIGALLLLSGFTLFTAVLVAIGAVMPTAKEAGVIFGPLMALIFVPFYAISLILSDPSAPIVQVFTYFPLSAPVTAMLRNGFGTLATGEAIVIIAMLFVLGILILRLAVHLFRYGSIQYSSKLSITGTLRRRPPELTGK